MKDNVILMKTEEKSTKLNRFTTLVELLNLLRSGKIVLRDPSHWEDKNDAEVVLEYKKGKKILKLFAVCFCIGDETLHHWKTYADGVAGCCIEFDKKKLLASFLGIHEVRCGDVEYKCIDQVQRNQPDLDHFPFIKRMPYQFEKEFRILWEGKTSGKRILLDIDLNSINKITLSQKIPDDMFASVKKLLCSIIKNPSTEINKSTLYKNHTWIEAFKKRKNNKSLNRDAAKSRCAP
jgi:hypothetical protein